jgi:hypothetical protein
VQRGAAEKSAQTQFFCRPRQISPSFAAGMNCYDGGKVDQLADDVSETKCFKSCSNIPSSSRTPQFDVRSVESYVFKIYASI